MRTITFTAHWCTDLRSSSTIHRVFFGLQPLHPVSPAGINFRRGRAVEEAAVQTDSRNGYATTTPRSNLLNLCTRSASIQPRLKKSKTRPMLSIVTRRLRTCCG